MFKEIIILITTSFIALCSSICTLTDKVVIVGGGPAGLSTALVLESRGWKDITIIEKRSPSSFETEKAYLYFLDGRGQRLTDSIRATSLMAERATGSSSFTTINVFTPDSKIKVNPIPALKSDIEKYWLPRSAMLDVLLQKVNEINGQHEDAGIPKPIKIHFNSLCNSIEQVEDGSLNISANCIFNGTFTLPCHFLIGCDGINSEVRKWLESGDEKLRGGVIDATSLTPLKEKFSLETYPSPAAGLKYKILKINSNFLVPTSEKDENGKVIMRETSPEEAFSIRGIKAPPTKRLRLGLLPIKNGGASRTANIINRPDHEIWSVENQNPDNLLKFLKKSFPQIDWDNFTTTEELERFAYAPIRSFPEPQTCKGMQQILYTTTTNPVPATISTNGESEDFDSDTKNRPWRRRLGSAVLLLGDSVHAFPPDLGQGVNCALEDVYALEKCLIYNNNDLEKALPELENKRLPESHAMCKLMQFGSPYQYGQNPPRNNLILLNFVLRATLHKILPPVFHPCAMNLIGDQNISYQKILMRCHATTRRLLALSGLLIVGFWRFILKKPFFI